MESLAQVLKIFKWYVLFAYAPSLFLLKQVDLYSNQNPIVFLFLSNDCGKHQGYFVISSFCFLIGKYSGSVTAF